MNINFYFDKIYVLNLYKRDTRKLDISNRLSKIGIKYDIFNGVDGSSLKYLYKKLESQFFSNPNYLGCSLSHLSIYNDALEKGYRKILIIEDDVLVNKNLHHIFESLNLPEWKDLLYLGYIPLSDDMSMWDYSIISNYIEKGIFIPRNLWGLYSYGISNSLMESVINDYNECFPMEIDRYFVKYIQPRNSSIALSPQLFCCQDIYSDNMSQFQINMKERSIDRRFAKIEDYI